MPTTLQQLPSEILRYHILPFTSGLAQDLIPLFNSCSLLRSKFKEFCMIFSCEGRKCFQNSKFILKDDVSVAEMDWNLELNEGFVALLESGLFERVHLDFRWTKLSETMAKLLTREVQCLNSISQIEVYERIGNVESILLNANWKHLSVLKFKNSMPSSISLKSMSKTIQKKQIVDISKITNLEKFEMNENIRFQIPKKSNNIESNLQELKLARHDSFFFEKLFQKCKFPQLESLEISNCDLQYFDFSTVKSFKLKSLSLTRTKLNRKQFIELFQDGKLSNLESLRITVPDETIFKELFESSIFSKTLSKLVIEREYSFPAWNCSEIWKYFMNGTLKNIKHLNVPWMDLDANDIQSLIESKILLEGLVVDSIIGYKDGDFRKCFRNLTEFRMLGYTHDITFPFNEMKQLKHLSFKCGQKIPPLNLPKLESIEGYEASLCFEKNSTSNLKHFTCFGSEIYSIVNSLIEYPMNLESFHWNSGQYDQDRKRHDALRTIATHSNFANLKELEIDYRLEDSCIEHLAHSQLKLNSLIINSLFLTGKSAYEICDGSIESKMIQLRFCHDYVQDPIYYSGSLNGLIQLLTNLDNQECAADFIEEDNQWYYYTGPVTRFLTYDDYSDVFGRGIVSEVTLDDSNKRKFKSEKIVVINREFNKK